MTFSFPLLFGWGVGGRVTVVEAATKRRREVLSQMKAGASGLHSELGEHPYPMLLGYRKVDGRCILGGNFPQNIVCVYMAVHIQAMKIDTDKQKEKKDKACQR